MFQDIFHAPNSEAFLRIFLRWAHFVAGITWIGLLYFFNLVNVPFQKALDPDTKKKVNPDLLSRALWYFRWGAVVTVLVGLAYFAMYTLKGDVNNANTIGGGNVSLAWVLIAWLTYPIVLFIVEFLIIKKVAALTKDGRLFAVVMLVLVAIITWGLVKFFVGMLTVGGESWASNKTISIGVGGAKCLGHHLAQQQANYRGYSGHRTRSTSGTGPAGLPRIKNERLVIPSAAPVHGHITR
jgi:uncharacterized membrane protein